MMDEYATESNSDRYSAEEVKAILHRALDGPEDQLGHQSPVGSDDRFTRQDLAEMATEVGISRERLREAERAWRLERLEREDKRSKQAFIRYRRKKLLADVVKYAGAAVILYLVHLSDFFIFPALAIPASIVLFIKGLEVLGDLHQAYLDTESEAFDQRYEKWLARQSARQIRARRQSFKG